MMKLFWSFPFYILTELTDCTQCKAYIVLFRIQFSLISILICTERYIYLLIADIRQSFTNALSHTLQRDAWFLERTIKDFTKMFESFS